MKPLAPGDPATLGRFRILAVVGRGGMGRVLLGQAPDGRLVAVKQIDAHLTGDAEFAARFRREVAASQKVTGAYTAGVVDHDAEAEHPWLASEYIAGPALGDMITAYGGLSLSGLKLLAIGLAMALQEIHRTGLVHRDLKPSNVLLTNEGPRVIDFGIARALEEDTQLTATGTVIGSPAYMSPEQAECLPLGPASDVFSVGAILAFAATGISPFHGVSTPQTLYNVLYQEPRLGEMPEPVRAIVLRCLAKDPEARPTPAELLDAAQAIPAEPVWPVRIRKRIAEFRDAAAGWAAGVAAYDAEPGPAVPAPRWWRTGRPIVAAALVALLGIGATLVWGTGIDGHATAMTEPALRLTPAEARELDLCALVAPDVLGEMGEATGSLRDRVITTGGCSNSYLDPSGKSVSYQVSTYMGASVDDIYDPMGSAIAWMPVLGSAAESRYCSRAVVAQSGTPMSIQVQTSVDQGNSCPQAERALAAVVRRLTVNPPLRKLPANSIFRLDVCALVKHAADTVAGDPARRRTDGPIRCRIDGRDAEVDVELVTKLRPDRDTKSYEEVRVGDFAAYIDGRDARYCSVSLLHRPAESFNADQVSVVVRQSRASQVAPCDAAISLLTSVARELPKP
ncbi:serine/threonine-protein kinase [Nocardia thailandica]|uniref:Serine/threonine-protein kinase n=1 Tax=Nocardia thailandica TaxID=257275 RepID=A0ABW6PGK1_9NOCA